MTAQFGSLRTGKPFWFRPAPGRAWKSTAASLDFCVVCSLCETQCQTVDFSYESAYAKATFCEPFIRKRGFRAKVFITVYRFAFVSVVRQPCRTVRAEQHRRFRQRYSCRRVRR